MSLPCNNAHTKKKKKKILTDVLKFSIFLCHFADREAVAKIMAMSGSLAPPLPPEALRPQRQATFTFGSNRRNMYRTAPDPRGFYAQSWMPYYEDRNASEDRRVREMDRRLAVYEQLFFFFFFSNIQIVSQKLADANEKILADVKLSLVVRFFHEMCFFFLAEVIHYPSYQCYSVAIHSQICAQCRDVRYDTQNPRSMFMTIVCLW